MRTILLVVFLVGFFAPLLTMKQVEKRNQKARKNDAMSAKRSRQTSGIVRVVSVDEDNDNAVKKAIKKEKDRARYQRKKAKEQALKEMDLLEKNREKKRKSRDKASEAELRRYEYRIIITFSTGCLNSH